MSNDDLSESTTAWVDDASAPLLTDLYEFTMAEAYLREGMTEPAVFSLFSRRLPPSRNYLLACGLEQVLTFLERLSFSADTLGQLASLRLFSPTLMEWLGGLRFSGDVYAVPEGTPVFADEPLL